MTLNDFFQMLESCHCQWSVDKNGYIMDQSDDCPIWAVYRVYDESDDDDEYAEDVFEAGERIGLSHKQVSSIMRAADDSTPHNKNVRKRLLEFVGEPTP